MPDVYVCDTYVVQLNRHQFSRKDIKAVEKTLKATQLAWLFEGLICVVRDNTFRMGLSSHRTKKVQAEISRDAGLQ